MSIIKPTLVIDKEKAKRNLRRMFDKVLASPGVRFRPHFKTHQSALVAEWYRELGINSCTVSSLEMAEYFYRHGWRDITVAVLVNRRELARLNDLAGKANINVVIDSAEAANYLRQNLSQYVRVWLKIDTGYRRTGLEYDRMEEIISAARIIREESPLLELAGILTHAGDSYEARSAHALKELFRRTAERMQAIKHVLEQNGIGGVEISVGDTPTCSAVDTFQGVDEVRPGNFIFNDVMQFYIGSCSEEDIAVAVVCPILASYPRRGELAIYGGAVHLSKESLIAPGDKKIHGLVAPFDETTRTWGSAFPNAWVKSLSQEHGIISAPPEFLQSVAPGQLLAILPVHSCLAADLLKHCDRH